MAWLKSRGGSSFVTNATRKFGQFVFSELSLEISETEQFDQFGGVAHLIVFFSPPTCECKFHRSVD
jgi:hypothetical protein